MSRRLDVPAARLGAGGACLLALLCAAAPALAGGLVRPDPALTPGATRRVVLAGLCAPRPSMKVPAVSPGLATEVLQRYRLAGEAPSDYVIDRLIPLSLGGSDDLDNLWPQSTSAQPWNASRKNEVEWLLHFLVCRRALPLRRAQEELASDWIGAYARYIGAPSGALEVDAALPGRDQARR
jgi:hypothetical protein